MDTGKRDAIFLSRQGLKKVILGARILKERTHYKHTVKGNNHASKNNTRVTVGSIIIKYVNRQLVHYPLPYFNASMYSHIPYPYEGEVSLH